MRNTDWLKNILSHISIGTITNACPLDEIQTAQRWLYIISFGQKYDARAEICEMVSGQPLRKIVKGRHVVLSAGKWKLKSNKRYIWIYTLKNPVVPGDVLVVNIKKVGFISVLTE